ncbi:MAG: di-trans,poly-cis-decaprenylcistransferase [Clostridia bacterium]|jgi:undecaprenyl diphosphate synthase|nr:di-trans,poly-cis-decaprenylcistransferase [Clostridia bacterium]
MKEKKTEEARLPRHVAVIMDGNGRWAKKRLLPRSAGHKAGVKRMLSLVDQMFRRGIKYVTLYALSAENLARPQEELNELFSLLRAYFAENVQKLKAQEIRLSVIGDRSLLPADIVQAIEAGERDTLNCGKGRLILAIAYGGRQEIVRAVNVAVAAGKQVTAEAFSALLNTAEIPDPDLMIRTGRETRISNFLLWQAAYTELYFSDKMFPEFSEKDLDAALRDYASRERRFGRVKE